MRKYLILEAFPWSGGDPAMGLRTNRVDSVFWQPSGRSREKVLGLQRFLASMVPYVGINRHQIVPRERINHKISKTVVFAHGTTKIK
jgi:hypothetical protein